MGKYRISYEAKFKRKVILCAEENGNRAAGRKFTIPEKMVRDWRKKRGLIFNCESSRRAFRGVKQGKYPDLEKKLVKFVLKLRGDCMPVTSEILKSKARELAREEGISLREFQVSRNWMARFMKRSGLSLRRRTSICQRWPADFENKLVNFQRYIIKLRTNKNYMMGQIGNADQTPVYFDMPSESTITVKGCKQVVIRSAGHEKSRVTVMLCCTADGRKLPPYVVLKRKTIPKKETFPKNIIIRANTKGWMNADMVKEWIDLVWFQRPGAALRQPSILVLDAFKGHTTLAVKEALSRRNTDLVIIPGGMTSQLQPLDVSVNKVFKKHLKDLYNAWLINEEHELTPSGKIKRPSCSLLAEWIVKAWSKIDLEVIRHAFIKCCISNSLDGSEDHLIGSRRDEESEPEDGSDSDNGSEAQDSTSEEEDGQESGDSSD